MNASASAVGAALKAERERQGLSIQKAADQMHLDSWVLEALEADDFERIGPSVFGKGHLKKYASLLGLPDEAIMAAYGSRNTDPRTGSSNTANPRSRSTAEPVSNQPWPQVVGAGVFALLVVGVFWWKPWQHRSAAPAPSVKLPPSAGQPVPADKPGASGPDTAISADTAAPPATASAAAAAATASVAPALIPTSLTAALAPPAAPLPAPVAGAGRARLRLSFSADSWVDVHDADGKSIFSGNGRANSVKTLVGAAPIRVYLKYASGVQLEINDRTVAIAPQFLAGDAARFEAGADGVLRRGSSGPPGPGAVAHGAAVRGGRPPG